MKQILISKFIKEHFYVFIKFSYYNLRNILNLLCLNFDLFIFGKKLKQYKIDF